MAFRGGFVR